MVSLHNNNPLTKTPMERYMVWKDVGAAEYIVGVAQIWWRWAPIPLQLHTPRKSFFLEDALAIVFYHRNDIK